MICVGAKVQFCPHYMISSIDTPEERRAKCITGTISFVNWEHSLFIVEYESGGTTQLEAFKIYDIGRNVRLCK